MSTDQQQPEVELPGYKLIDRLGSGGYGEVWRAEAPGGLSKAVKVVFGRYDQQRAAIEMKAMERVKSLRHPFLLSLERIEIVENRLFVVTELADGSLRDRFHQCQANDLTGIPRDELLRYLGDAADALDFLCDQSELQHLDVKPENLLLVAGHVKVADFGLVKDIYTSQASLVGGMTPSYAAPELFKGRPTRYSDQYSLAILYQELLTGTLPFVGATAAELTLQHINDPPNLEPLSEDDRFVISQALSKDPDHRFGSCREMVEALRSQSASESFAASTMEDSQPAAPAAPAASFSGPTVAPEAHSVTQVFDDDQSDWSAQSAPVLFELPEIEPCRLTEQPKLADEPLVNAPAVVIGLGGTAAPVMRALGERIVSAFGNDEARSAVGMLLIDTDPKGISAAVRDSGENIPLKPTETLSAPLRRPQDYRNDSSRLLHWLSRRWLYNIPKSLRTDGIRPLGRLALVDHARQVAQRIRLVLQEAADFDRVAEIESRTGMTFRRNAVRVYLVGSISGGTGSGMLLDMAYLVRASLDRMDIGEKQIIGVTTHSTARDAEKGELGRVNAFAWLAELDYLSRPDVAYPGDDSAGLPRHEPSVAPFDDLYLIDMGERLDPATFARETESIADYLFVDMFSPAQQFLDACRSQQTENVESSEVSPLRTFAVHRSTRLSVDASRDWAQLVKKGLLEHWCGIPEVPAAKVEPTDSTLTAAGRTTGAIVHGAAQYVGQNHLDGSGLAAHGRSVIEKCLGGEIVKKLRTSIQKAGFTPQTLTRDKAVALIDEMIDRRESDEPRNWLIEGEPVAELAKQAAARVTSALGDWIVARCDLPQERLPSAERAVEWFRDHVNSLTEPLDRMRASLDSEIAALMEGPGSATTDDIGRQVVRLWKLRIDQAAIGVARQIAGEMALSLDTIRERLGAVHQTLQSLLNDTKNAEATESRDLPAGEWMARLVNELDQRLQGDHLEQAGGLLRLCEEDGGAERLSAAIQDSAEQIVCQSSTVRKLAAQQPGLEPLEDDAEEPALESLTPRLNEQGGEYCHLFLAPENEEPDETANESSARIVTSLPDAYCIAESWGLSVAHVAARFVSCRRDYAQLASRVHARQDIDWPSLISEPETESERVEQGPVLATQVLAPESESVASAPSA